MDGRQVFTVHAAAFRRWFGATRCRSVLLWLRQRGLLLLGDRQITPSRNSTEWAERTPRWPDGCVQKSFVFRWPEIDDVNPRGCRRVSALSRDHFPIP
jgi:hypothetical protein